MVDFHERHDALHSTYARRFAQLVALHNNIRASASSVIGYRDLMAEIADASRSVAAAAEEVVAWMAHHDEIRESPRRG